MVSQDICSLGYIISSNYFGFIKTIDMRIFLVIGLACCLQASYAQTVIPFEFPGGFAPHSTESRIVDNTVIFPDVQIRWAPVSGASQYRLNVSLISPSGSVFNLSPTLAPAFSTLDSQLPGTGINWRVQALCGSENSPFSPYQTLVVPDLLVFREGEQPSSAMEAFPNPFTSSVSFRFNAPERGRTRVTLMDLKGNTVAETSWTFEPGVNQIAWDLSALPSGSYIVVAPELGLRSNLNKQ